MLISLKVVTDFLPIILSNSNIHFNFALSFHIIYLIWGKVEKLFRLGNIVWITGSLDFKVHLQIESPLA